MDEEDRLAELLAQRNRISYAPTAGLPELPRAEPQRPSPDRQPAHGDTLSGWDRHNMMQFVDRMGGDTTRVNQAELMSKVGPAFADSISNARREMEPDYSTRVYPDINIRPAFENSNVSGWVPRGDPRVVHARNPDEMYLNLAAPAARQAGARLNLTSTPAQQEMGEPDRLRNTALHEWGHTMGKSELESDLYAAAFDGMSKTEPGRFQGAAFRDAGLAAARSYEANANAYKLDRDPSMYAEGEDRHTLIPTPSERPRFHERYLRGAHDSPVRKLARTPTFESVNANKDLTYFPRLAADRFTRMTGGR